MCFRLPFNMGCASVRRVEPEQMRQPDNLHAFCRIHRNGRPLTGISGYAHPAALAQIGLF